MTNDELVTITAPLQQALAALRNCLPTMQDGPDTSTYTTVLGSDLRLVLEALDAAQRDAERYRWLRDNSVSRWAICEWHFVESKYYKVSNTPRVVDTAVDAAKKEQP